MNRLDEIKELEAELFEEIAQLHCLGQHGLLRELRDKLEKVRKEKEKHEKD